MKSIDEQIAEHEAELKKDTKFHKDCIKALKKQKGCDHVWEYTPYQEGDSFCFQRDIGETVRCTKCGESCERDTHPNYSKLPPEWEEVFRKVKAQ